MELMTDILMGDEMNTPENQLCSKVEALVSDNKERFAAMQDTIQGVADQVETLTKVLVIGNGQPALTVRVALIEQVALEARKEFRDFKAQVEADKKAEEGSKKQRIVVFVTCLISLLTAIIPHLFALITKHP